MPVTLEALHLANRWVPCLALLAGVGQLARSAWGLEPGRLAGGFSGGPGCP